MKTADLHQIARVIDKGIYFLKEHQFHHGEFCSYVGQHDDMKKWCVTDSTNFVTSLIGHALLPLKDDPTVNAMLMKAVYFLRYHMMRGGTWNYFTSSHRVFTMCPADTDDTACVSHFLKEMGYTFPDNRDILLANRNKAGLFYTWFALRPDSIFHLNKDLTYWRLLLREFKHPLDALFFWNKGACTRKDVDAGVNANILYYLGLTKETAPIVSFLINIIKEHKEDACDKWYLNPLVIYYYISRNYNNGVTAFETIRKPIIERILAVSKPDGMIGNADLDTALAAGSLLNLRYDGNELDAAVNYLMRSQAENGSWTRHIFYWGGPAKESGWGSEELTTAFCLEALARYRRLRIDQKETQKSLHEVS